jgi:pilus assembly protein FimV
MQNGKPVILVSSSQPVKEPFINFLLEVSWPKGQLLKEYTVLLDPPVLMQPGTSIASNTVGVRPDPSRRTQAQPQQQATAAQQQRQQQQRQRVIAQQQQTREQQLQRQRQLQQQRQQAQNDGLRRPGPAGSVASNATGGNQSKTYRIRRGDTLFKVAKKLGYNGVRNEQMMMAIYQANPTAFRKRNINNLKAGVNVRRPSINEAKRVSLRSARQDIRSQTAEWKRSTPKKSSASTSKQIAQNGAGKTAGNNAPTKNSQARIEVLGSTNNMNSANSGNLVGQAKLDDLNRQMTLASESLTARTRENNELKSRVSELEALLKKKNRLITLKNEQLAELQVSLGQPPSAMNSNEADVEGTINEQGGEIEKMLASQDGNDGTIVRTQDPADAIINDMGQNDDIFQETVPDDISTALAPSQPVEEEGGILDLLSSPLVLGLGGGSLLALIAGFLFLRRRNSGDDEYDDYSPIDFDDPSFAPGGSDFDEAPQSNADPISEMDDPFAGLGGSSSPVENNFDVDPMDELIQEEEISKPAATIASAPVSAPVSNDGDVDDDGDDILQEADVYIVYGLHEQAEVELKKAIEKQPGNLEYRAKLLENYHASDNKEAFEIAATEFSQLNGPGKDELWEKVSDWGTKMLPASALFASPGVAAVVSESVAKVDVETPKSDDDGLTGLGMLGAAAATGGVAITAGKAFAENAQDKISETISPDSDSAEVLDFDDMDLDSLLSADTQAKTEVVTALDDDFGFEDADLDSVVQDFEVDAKTEAKQVPSDSNDEHEMDFDFSEFEIDDAPVAPPSAETAKSESSELEGLEDFGDLDFDLDDIGAADDVDGKMVSPNLNLALDGSNTGMGKILPENSVYKMSEAKDDILGEMDDDLSFLDLDSGADTGLMEAQVGTKLDLARAYMDMGDVEGARSTLEEVMVEGNDNQRKEAKELLTQAG